MEWRYCTVPLIFNLANFQVPVAIPPGKNPGTHRVSGWMGPITGLNVFAKKKKTYYLLAGFKPRIPQLIDRQSLLSPLLLVS